MTSGFVKTSLVILLLLNFIIPVAKGAEKPVLNLDTGERFLTIQGAVGDPDTDDNDKIRVYSDQYDSAKEPGHHRIGDAEAFIFIDKSLTITSTKGPKSTVIDGRKEHKVTVSINADGVTLKGFTVTGAVVPDEGKWAAGIHATGVKDIRISNNRAVGNQGDGVHFFDTVNSKITGNVITNNNTLQDMFWVGNGIELHRSDNNEVLNNRITKNESSGIYIFGSSQNKIKSNQLNNNKRFGS
ncbi:right-handed parallel beta-helix repeat-containing protein, partial [Candidatus Bipolaricaulota bacterium]|nr:right-handed parallel beta-helix repeat-containing protein [Candidatus Bipolaricaulota bacterium]